MKALPRIALCLLLALCLTLPSFGSASPVAAAIDAVVTNGVATDSCEAASAQQQQQQQQQRRCLTQKYLQADAHTSAAFAQKASSQAGISSPNKTEQVTVATAGAAGPLVAGLAIAGFSASTALAANDVVGVVTGKDPLHEALTAATGSEVAATGIRTGLDALTMFVPGANAAGAANAARTAGSKIVTHADDIARVGSRLAENASNAARATGRAANTAEHLAGQAENVAQKVTNNGCFTEGTEVATPNGQIAIEDIAAGDTVYAYDFALDKQVEREVVKTFIKQADELIVVHLKDDTIKATTEHPFWVKDAGWTDAKDLKAGDILHLADGSTTAVIDIEHIALEVPTQVYNFEVQGAHDYYVGSLQVLVHNNCTAANVAQSAATGTKRAESVNLASEDRTIHILYGDKTGGGHLWPGKSGKSAFPETWSTDKVMHNISDVATDPTLSWIPNKTVKGVQRYEITGVRDGIDIRVITDGADIITAFPGRR